MTGTVEVDPDGQSLLIRFPYREDLVSLVKEFQGRRWDPKAKVWRVPASQVERVYAMLARHLFDFAPEVSSLLVGTLGKPAAAAKPAAPARPAGLPLGPATAGDAAPAAAPGGDALTISALNQRVRDGLRQLFPEAFWVVGEVVDFDKSAGRAHRFFQLVEKAKDQPRAVAAVEVALFESTAQRLLPRLQAGEDPLTLRDGIEIRAQVKVDFYPASGRFQVVVQDIDPSFTLGKLALTREQILRELRQQGLAERNRSLGFPVPALRIGLLTSPDADGCHDFLRHVETAGAGLDVTLFPIKVQGPELKTTLLQGLRWFAARAAEFDVLCIVRGGGSRTDLAWFDDRDLALAVAKHPLKIVVGIGHQRDQSVLDAIAHSEKTPTAVAALLVDGVQRARDGVREQAQRLQAAVAAALQDGRQGLAAAATRLQRAADRLLQDRRRDLAVLAQALQSGAVLRLHRERAALAAAARGAAFAVQRRVDRAAAGLDQQAMRLRLLDPARVLGRGYALVRTADGRVVPAAARLHPGDGVVLHFRDGRAAARIDRIDQASP